LVYFFAPLSWLLGVDLKDILIFGQLVGQKTFFNEFVAYANWVHMYTTNPNVVSPRFTIMLSYALCNLSNFLSIGIQIGSIGSISPQCKITLVQFGIKSFFAGILACLQTAIIAGFC